MIYTKKKGTREIKKYWQNWEEVEISGGMIWTCISFYCKWVENVEWVNERKIIKKKKKIRGGADVLKLIGKREWLLVFVNVIWVGVVESGAWVSGKMLEKRRIKN